MLQTSEILSPRGLTTARHQTVIKSFICETSVLCTVLYSSSSNEKLTTLKPHKCQTKHKIDINLNKHSYITNITDLRLYKVKERCIIIFTLIILTQTKLYSQLHLNTMIWRSFSYSQTNTQEYFGSTTEKRGLILCSPSAGQTQTYPQ